MTFAQNMWSNRLGVDNDFCSYPQPDTCRTSLTSLERPLSEQILATYPCQIIVVHEPTADPNKAFIGTMLVFPTADLETYEDGVLVSAHHFDSQVPA